MTAVYLRSGLFISAEDKGIMSLCFYCVSSSTKRNRDEKNA